MKLGRAARELRAVKVAVISLQSLKPIFLSVCFQSSLSVSSNLRIPCSSRPPTEQNWIEHDVGHKRLEWLHADRVFGLLMD